MAGELFVDLALASVSHHDAKVPELEAARLPEGQEFLRMAREQFRGVILLQTCNRVELFVQGTGPALAGFLGAQGKKGYQVMEGEAVLRHLLELAAGIDSMIVGEDQILGQLKEAAAASRDAGASSPVLDLCIDKAVHAGIRVRELTRINRGAVSIGSAAVILAEQLLGDLRQKHILVVGSGEMGMLVAKALMEKDLTAIYVANRTYERAVTLAEKIGGRAVYLKDLYHYIALSDVVISCTSAPHPIIHCDGLAAAMKERQWPTDRSPRPLVLIDIAQPRDVEENAGEIPGVSLFTIDNLRSVSDQARKSRLEEAERAREFVRDEVSPFAALVNRAAADDTLSVLYTWAEAIRTRERDRALHRLGDDSPRTAEILDDLTRVIVKKLLSDATISIRECAEHGEMGLAESIVRAITEGEKICFPRDE
ncbi:MAG: glutamyl-tRNA reductase [Methanomicrobiales archaeon]|nr:glutamyl-tRNA reductase [Methanomicrobiales archaeon]MDD1644865.1 glutamyl-tRNA reductase [Methanomicrobiales archaeon]